MAQLSYWERFRNFLSNIDNKLQKVNQYNPIYQVNRSAVNIGKKLVGIGEPGAGIIGKEYPGINAITRAVETKSTTPIKQYGQEMKTFNSRSNWIFGHYTPEQEAYLNQHPEREGILKNSLAMRSLNGGNEYINKKGVITPEESKLFPTSQIAVPIVGDLQDIEKMSGQELAFLIKQQSKNYFKKEGYNIDKMSPSELEKAYRSLAHKYHPDKPLGSKEAFKQLQRYYEATKKNITDISKSPSLIKWFKGLFSKSEQPTAPKLLQGETTPLAEENAITGVSQSISQPTIPIPSMERQVVEGLVGSTDKTGNTLQEVNVTPNGNYIVHITPKGTLKPTAKLITKAHIQDFINQFPNKPNPALLNNVKYKVAYNDAIKQDKQIQFLLSRHANLVSKLDSLTSPRTGEPIDNVKYQEVESQLQKNGQLIAKRRDEIKDYIGQMVQKPTNKVTPVNEQPVEQVKPAENKPVETNTSKELEPLRQKKYPYTEIYKSKKGYDTGYALAGLKGGEITKPGYKVEVYNPNLFKVITKDQNYYVVTDRIHRNIDGRISKEGNFFLKDKKLSDKIVDIIHQNPQNVENPLRHFYNEFRKYVKGKEYRYAVSNAQAKDLNRFLKIYTAVKQPVKPTIPKALEPLKVVNGSEGVNLDRIKAVWDKVASPELKKQQWEAHGNASWTKGEYISDNLFTARRVTPKGEFTYDDINGLRKTGGKDKWQELINVAKRTVEGENTFMTKGQAESFLKMNQAPKTLSNAPESPTSPTSSDIGIMLPAPKKVPLTEEKTPETDLSQKYASQGLIKGNEVSPQVRKLASDILDKPENEITPQWLSRATGNDAYTMKEMSDNLKEISELTKETPEDISSHLDEARQYIDEHPVEDSMPEPFDSSGEVKLNKGIKGNVPPVLLNDIGIIEQGRASWRVLESLGEEQNLAKGQIRSENKIAKLGRKVSDDMLTANANTSKRARGYVNDIRNSLTKYGSKIPKEDFYDMITGEKPVPSDYKYKNELQDAIKRVNEYTGKLAKEQGLPEEYWNKPYLTQIHDIVNKNAGLGKAIDPDILEMSRYMPPKEINNPFLQKRNYDSGYIKDPYMALDIYTHYANRKIDLDPIVKELDKLGGKLAYKGLSQSFQYVTNLSKQIAGERLDADIQFANTKAKINRAIDSIINKTGIKTPTGIDYVGQGVNEVIGWMYPTFLSGVQAPIRNTFQQSLIVAKVGTRAYLAGVKMSATPSWRRFAYENSRVLNVRLTSYLPGFEESYIKSAPKKVRSALMYLFKLSDRQNVVTAFLSGYWEAIKAGYPVETAVLRGDEVAKTTQYLYNKLFRSAIERTELGRWATIFTSWGNAFAEFLNDLVQGNKSNVYLDYNNAHPNELTPKMKAMGKKSYAGLVRFILIYLFGMYLQLRKANRERIKWMKYLGGVGSFGQITHYGGGVWNEIQPIFQSFVDLFGEGDPKKALQEFKKYSPKKQIVILKEIDAFRKGDWAKLFFYTGKKKTFKNAPLGSVKKGGADPLGLGQFNSGMGKDPLGLEQFNSGTKEDPLGLGQFSGKNSGSNPLHLK